MSVPRPRVLWLTQNHPPQSGGMAESCDRIVRGLQASGMTVDVVHMKAPAAAAGSCEKAGGFLWQCPDSNEPEHLLNVLWQRLRAAAAERAWSCVVAFGGVLPLLAGPVYAAWLNTPLLVLFRGNDFDTGIFSGSRRALLNDAVGRAAAVGVNSRDTLRRLAALYPGARLHWLPNGIDLAQWQALPADREQAARWRAQQVPAGRLVLGIFGELKEKKGGALLLRALAASGCAERFHLLVVGKAPAALTAALADVPGLTSTLLPFTDRYALIPLYCACDWQALPSLYDGLPNVLLEAGAFAVPCLGSDAGGMPDVVTDGEHGLLGVAGDADALTRALRRAAAMPAAEREACGARLAARITTEFTAQHERARYGALLAELTDGGKQ